MLCSYLLALLSSAAAYSQIQSQNISDSDDIYNSSSFVGYSLWLTPDSPDFLQEIIDEQAKDLGTKRFPPHITLLGGLEAVCLLVHALYHRRLSYCRVRKAK